MNSDSIYAKLLRAIRERLPQSQIVDALMDILCIGKEATYRRLRGEVPFTLEEAVLISKKLGISMDNIAGTDDPKSRPFELKTTAFVDPSLSDYYQMQGWIETFEKMTLSSNLEMGESGNVFDLNFFYPYLNLCRFYHFKWQYQWRGKESSKHFEEIVFSNEQRKLQLDSTKLSKKVKKAYYIWDNMIFQYIINDILYFKDIRLITNDDITNIKKDLLELIDYLELIAEKGCYETGNSVQFYISNINSDATYSYYQCEFLNLTLIRALTLNALSSTDERTAETVKAWILSQKRLATLISESGEMQRIRFFNKQRKIVTAI